MEITNKTKRPLRVPLPGGKKLHLGPGKTGQITTKATELPSVKKMIEDGDIEVIGGGRDKNSGLSDGSKGMGSSQNMGGASGVRHTGDR
ncbi:MAG: hypothetical protein ACI8X5_001962 [Planctomycetota bacterium]|jgi:hypothetical protein